MTSFDLTDRVALVTGGSRGIGRSISLALAAHGAHVVVSSRKLDACQALVEEIEAQGGKASAAACNAGELEQVQSLVTDCARQQGRLDVLVNNAAANPWFGPLMDLEIDVYDKVVDVNLRGTLFASITAANIMKDQGGGAIIHTGSINARQPVIGQGIYSITKGAVTTMTRSMGKEMARHKIRVNAILPGITKTDALEDLFQGGDELPEPWKSQVPMRRHGMPDEMAGAAVFLASDASSYMTGQTIVIDGGITL